MCSHSPTQCGRVQVSKAVITALGDTAILKAIKPTDANEVALNIERAGMRLEQAEILNLVGIVGTAIGSLIIQKNMKTGITVIGLSSIISSSSIAYRLSAGRRLKKAGRQMRL